MTRGREEVKFPNFTSFVDDPQELIVEFERARKKRPASENDKRPSRAEQQKSLSIKSFRCQLCHYATNDNAKLHRHMESHVNVQGLNSIHFRIIRKII